MANWAGIYTNAKDNSTLTAADATSFTNTNGSAWPTSAGVTLANMYIRILTAGREQTVLINSNTGTVGQVAAWTNGTPQVGDTYEIVVILSNNDHFTAATTFTSSATATHALKGELANNGTFLFDGLYIFTIGGTFDARWGKTAETMPTFCANNRTVIGKSGFWNTINFTGSVPVTMKHVRFLDSVNSHQWAMGGALPDGSLVSHIWIENCSGSSFYLIGGTPSGNITIKNFYCRNLTAGTPTFPNASQTIGVTLEKWWAENCTGFALPAMTNAGVRTQIFRDCVFKNAQTSSAHTTTDTLKNAHLIDCYLSALTVAITIARNSTGTTGNGEQHFKRNVTTLGREILSNAANSFRYYSRHNDYLYARPEANKRIDISSVPDTATSDDDYITGGLLACEGNIDTTEATLSTASPSQYGTLTAARTNARTTRNKSLGADNVVESALGPHGVTITYDSENCACSENVVAVDSAAGQKTLTISSTAAATATLNLTNDIILTSVAAGTGRNNDTLTIQVLAAAPNAGNEVDISITGTAAAITIQITPNNGTEADLGLPIYITTAELVEFINTGAIAGKTLAVSDTGSLRNDQTATGGGAQDLINGGEGDGVVATFSGSINGVLDYDVYGKIEVGTRNGDRFEVCEIASISGNDLVMVDNLVYTHTAAQADPVEKVLRNWGLPVIFYGTSTGVYPHSTILPPADDFGKYFTEVVPSTYQGEAQIFSQRGHTKTLTKLQDSTTYYYKAGYYTPLGELALSAEGTFTTTADSVGAGAENIRLGVSETIQGVVTPGTLDLPLASDLRYQVTADNGNLVGTYRNTDPGIANVSEDAAPYYFDSELLQGTLHELVSDNIPVNKVQAGYSYLNNDEQKEGTLEVQGDTVIKQSAIVGILESSNIVGEVDGDSVIGEVTSDKIVGEVTTDGITAIIDLEI